MPQVEFIRDLVVIFGVSIAVVLVFHRLRMPSIAGFLLAGALVGPSGLNLVDNTARVELLAEVGVALLLFSIGLDISLARLARIRVFVLSGGGLQVLVTVVLITVTVFTLTSASLRGSIFWGFLIALSSTAIVLKLLMDRGELDAPHGRLALAILVFQDLIVVPMMLILPLLGGELAGGPLEIAITLGRSLLLIGVILLAARWLVPKALSVVVRVRSRELFVIAVLLICAGIAWAAESQGLSLALGAFIAGMVISESEYSHQALADIMPFRDSFISLFFVSIGMLLDLRTFMQLWPLLLLLTVGVLVLKGAVAGGVTLALGYPFRVAVLVGLALSQVGEFSFVMAQTGRELGLLSPGGNQQFLAISIVTMVVTPLLIQWGPAVLMRAGSAASLPAWLNKTSPSDAPPSAPARRDHVIIAGFGLNGRNLARVLKEAGIPYVIVDLYADTIRRGLAQGEPMHYGDVTQREVLERLGIEHARLLVLAVSDPFATRRVIPVARQANPEIHIVARTRYVREVEELLRLGADQVVPEEFETSIEIFELVLGEYDVPPRDIKRKQEAIRREGYARLRREAVEPYTGHGELPIEVDVHYQPVHAGSPLIGRRLADLRLHDYGGVHVPAIIRQGQTHAGPDGAWRLEPDDCLVMTGAREAIGRAVRALELLGGLSQLP
ncbi:MAG TPA: cation:proton antiporter [Nitrospiria bacterium]|nr:cation:proton antiporter [Nitrospiria bacterium]